MSLITNLRKALLQRSSSRKIFIRSYTKPRYITAGLVFLASFVAGVYLIFFSHAQSGFVGQWDPLGGVTPSAPAASSWGAGRLDVFVRGTDNAIYHKWYQSTSGWSGWERLGGTTYYAPAAVSWGANRIDFLYVGTNCHLYHGWWDGASWHIGEDLGGCLTSAPTISSWGAGRLDMFARGTDNALWHTWFDGTTGGWHGWESLGGCLGGAGGATSEGPYRIDIVVRGCDNVIYHKYYDRGAGGWENGFDSLGGITYSAPSISSWTGHLDVFVRDTSNRVEHNYYDWGSPSWSGWQGNVGGQTYDAPASVSWSPGRIDVFVTGTDNGVWHTYYAPIANSIGSSLPIGNSIPSGYALYSPSYHYQAIMQYDGNFVVRDMTSANAVWSTGTNGSGSNVVNFQTDGNLVVRPSGGAAAWASGTNTYGGVTLSMQDDGNLVMYDSTWRAVWSWETGKIPPPPPPPPCDPAVDDNCPPPNSWAGNLSYGYNFDEYLLQGQERAVASANTVHSVRLVLFCATDQCSGTLSHLNALGNSVRNWYKAHLGTGHTFKLIPAVKITGSHPAAYYYGSGGYNASKTFNHLAYNEPALQDDDPNQKTLVMLGFRAMELHTCGEGWQPGDLGVMDPFSCSLGAWSLAHELGHNFGLGHISGYTNLMMPTADHSVLFTNVPLDAHQRRWLLYNRKAWFQY